jgi:pseudaminic acid cytidylyltransferase
MGSCLAVITARGGSKRIPRKNIKEFRGLPVIAYPIKAALESGCFELVMVSTDDTEIASVAESFGAEVPFLRSAETANDTATSASVIAEVLAEWKRRGRSFEDVCCLYPTAPFLTGEKIKRAHELLQVSRASALISVVRFDYPVQRALRMVEGKISLRMPEFKDSRSQDLEPFYHDAGQMYWLHGREFLKRMSFFTDDAVGFELSETEVQDIDTMEDWEIAELKHQRYSARKHPGEERMNR